MDKFKIGDIVYLSREITDEDWRCSGVYGKGGCDTNPKLNTKYTIKNIEIRDYYIRLSEIPNWCFPAHCFELINNDPIKIKLDKIKETILDNNICIRVNTLEERNKLVLLYNEFSGKELNTYRNISDLPMREIFPCFMEKNSDNFKTFYRNTDSGFNEFKGIIIEFSDLIKPIIDNYGK